jgi:SAM-dependent methyltransferase
MDKNYFIRYYDYERNHWWFRARNKILINLIQKYRNQEPPDILNIGAATGYTSQLMESTGKVTSVEYDLETYHFIRDELKLNAVQGSVLKLPFNDESFDIVCAFDIVEHVKDDKTAVSEMIRVCRKNGLILITVPAFQFLWSNHDIINHHFKRYRRFEIKKLFSDTGTDRIYLSYFNCILFLPVVIARLAGKIFHKKGSTNDGLKSDFEKFNNNLASKIFYKIFSIEDLLIKRKIKLFPGVSIVGVYEKRG